MKAPLSWLKDYVDIDVTAQELTEKLFSCGLEVEELIYVGAEIDRCVVGKIEHIEKHPDADKLKICKLNSGGFGSDIQIVGAAMKKYATSKEKDIHKLMQYADQLRVKPKVLRYMEVLL